MAKHIIAYVLNLNEFFSVFQCISVKDLWNTLEVTHKRISYVNRDKKHVLIQNYEFFIMQ